MKRKTPFDLFSLRMQLALVIVLVEILFIDKLASAGIEFVLSSVIVTVALLIQLRFGIRQAAAAPADIVVFVFNWMFLDLAPKVQLIAMPRKLINTSTATADGVALTNLVCALFMISFTLFYVFLSRRGQNRADKRRRVHRASFPPARSDSRCSCACWWWRSPHPARMRRFRMRSLPRPRR